MKVSNCGHILVFGEGIDNDMAFHTECLEFYYQALLFQDYERENFFCIRCLSTCRCYVGVVRSTIYSPCSMEMAQCIL